MATIVSGGAGKTTKPAPAGTHRAVCIGVIDLGHHESNYGGKLKLQPKVLIQFELVDEPMDDGRPFALSRTFTASLNEKSALRPFLESWRGKAFTTDELRGFELKNVLGAPAFLSVIHSTKEDGRIFADIATAAAFPKGVTKPDKPSNPLRHFSVEDGLIPSDLPAWIIDRLKQSVEYENGSIYTSESAGRASTNGHAKADEVEAEDEIPF